MPLKTKNKAQSKHPHHYNKVYWPYIPLVLLIVLGLWLGMPMSERSQNGVLSYSTNISDSGLLSESNSVRQKNQQPRLVQNPQLAAAAQAKATDMANRNYWTHLTPEGKTPWTFIDGQGYAYQKAGENLAYGFATQSEVVTGWLNSPAHKENLLDKDYREVGYGVANSPDYQGSGPQTIVVALYATPKTTPLITSKTDSAVMAFSTTNPVTTPASQSISKVQVLTGGSTPWITFAVGLAAGIALALLIAKNGLHLHRSLKKGEKFVLKHPILDVTIVVFVAICALLSRSTGLIQ